MHYYLQRCYNETGALLHVHPTHVITAVYAGLELDKIYAK